MKILRENEFKCVTDTCEKFGSVIVGQEPARRVINIFNGHTSSRNYFLSFPHIMFSICWGKTKPLSQRVIREYQDEHDAPPSVHLSTDVGKYFIYGGHGVRMCFTDSEYSKVFVPSLLNVRSSDLSVCMGDHLCMGNHLEGLIKDVIFTFWSAPFSYDITSSLENYGGAFHFDRWQDATKKDPFWIPDDQFVNSGYSFASNPFQSFGEFHGLF